MKAQVQMPIINLDNVELTQEEIALAVQILKKNGSLYASKPGKANGEAKYLWRMVAFGISPVRQHHCIPVMAEFDLDGTPQEVRIRSKELDELAIRLERAVPVEERYGTLSWGRALGIL